MLNYFNFYLKDMRSKVKIIVHPIGCSIILTFLMFIEPCIIVIVEE